MWLQIRGTLRGEGTWHYQRKHTGFGEAPAPAPAVTGQRGAGDGPGGQGGEQGRSHSGVQVPQAPRGSAIGEHGCQLAARWGGTSPLFGEEPGLCRVSCQVWGHWVSQLSSMTVCDLNK